MPFPGKRLLQNSLLHSIPIEVKLSVSLEYRDEDGTLKRDANLQTASEASGILIKHSSRLRINRPQRCLVCWAMTQIDRLLNLLGEPKKTCSGRMTSKITIEFIKRN